MKRSGRLCGLPDGTAEPLDSVKNWAILKVLSISLIRVEEAQIVRRGRLRFRFGRRLFAHLSERFFDNRLALLANPFI